MYNIDLIQLIGLGKFLRDASGVGNLPVLACLQGSRHITGKRTQLRRYVGLELGQVNDGQGSLFPSAASGRLYDESVDDLLADLQCRQGRILGKRCQPVRIIPAGAGLSLLRRNQPVCVFRADQRCLCIAHQAGIEADEVKLHTTGFQSLGKLVKRHGCIRIDLVIAVAGHTSSAMIPENEHIAVGRIFLRTPLDKLRQCSRIGHPFVADSPVKRDHGSVRDLPALVRTGLHDVVAPSLGTTGLQYDFHIVAVGGIGHFIDIVGCHTIAGFQVGRDHVHQNGNGILSVPQNRCIPVTDSFRYRGIRCRHGRISIRGSRRIVGRRCGLLHRCRCIGRLRLIDRPHTAECLTEAADQQNGNQEKQQNAEERIPPAHRCTGIVVPCPDGSPYRTPVSTVKPVDPIIAGCMVRPFVRLSGMGAA